jgi:probable addiction module antidote protein
MSETKEKFSRYDAADYLTDDDRIAAFLDAVLEESGDDPVAIAQALAAVARARNMSQLARDAGMTREGLYKALSPEGNPSFATVVKVAKALGLRVAFKTA